MELVYKYPVLGSSADPKKIAMTVKGVLLAVTTLLVSTGVDITGLELTGLIDNIYNLIIQSGTIISTLTIVYGGIRKIINRFKE